jgi:RNAse (barnase) inhibitor barstar
MKNTHFILARPGVDIRKSFLGSFIGKVDGRNAVSVKDFLEQIGVVMHFPDYYGNNIDSLDEMLNDLEWIKEEKVVIYISASAEWLSKEKSENKIFTLIDMLDATAEDWKWIDDDDETARKDLKIVFEDSERIRMLLEDQEIPYSFLD